MSRRLYFLFICSLLLINNCNTDKPDRTNLLLSERVTKEISGGQADTFLVTLQEDRFIFASLFQKEVDVLVKVLSPRDSLIKETDDLKTGPEFISFTSSQEGTYKIIVQPFNPNAESGSYIIELEKNIKAGNTSTDLTNHLFAELDNKYRTGIAAAVIDSGKIVYKNWFGMADLKDKVPVKPSTILNICSIGKQFTAYAIALLEQQGKLSINDDIHKYIPEMYKFDHKITISNLLNHSSGLREIADLLELTGKKSSGPFSKEDAFNLIYSQRELNFTPGTEYMYCNTGYILLAEIIKRVTGETYINWMNENIFKPLDMNNTFIFYNKEDLGNEVAKSYTLGNDGNYNKEKLYNCWYVGAGNIFSTVEDMSKWLINFDYPKVGNKQTVLRLRENQISMDKNNSKFYTFGQVLDNYRGLEYFWHGGGGYGFTAQIVRFPGYKFGAIILSNFIYSSVYSRARKIADIYLKNYFTSIPESFNYNNPYRPAIINDSVLSGYTGNYLSDSGVITEITKYERRLFIQSGFTKTELYPLSDSVFFAKEANIRLFFSMNKSGNVSGFRAIINKNEERCKKIEDITSVPLKPFEGKYYSKELNTYFTIYESGKVLIAENSLNDKITLTHIKDNLFTGNRWYFSSVQFSGPTDSIMNEFRITNERVRNVKFVKVE